MTTDPIRNSTAAIAELSTEATAEHHRRRSWLRREADRICAMTPDVPQTDSIVLLREDRDR